MTLCASQVTSNADSKLLQIDAISDNVVISTPERMELIGRLVDDYRRSTNGSVERHRAKRAVDLRTLA